MYLLRGPGFLLFQSLAWVTYVERHLPLATMAALMLLGHAGSGSVSAELHTRRELEATRNVDTFLVHPDAQDRRIVQPRRSGPRSEY